MRSISIVLICLAGTFLIHGSAIAQAPSDGLAASATPFFKKYCYECHSGEKPEAEFSVEPTKLTGDFQDRAQRNLWREIVNVLNGHEMPPKDSPQPSAEETAKLVDWIISQTVRAEREKRETSTVLRRLNRAEYKNTIRDLLGIDLDVSGFPQDPPAGGFDNNGGALTMSPLQLETYFAAAQRALEEALPTGSRPETIKWRFTPKVGDADRTRLRLDAKNNPIVNGGKNRQEGEFVAVHAERWDRNVGARDFRVPTAGYYAIRVAMAARVPSREEVVASVEKTLAERRDRETEKNPKGKEHHDRQYERDLDHFRSDRMYDYGPPRAKLVLQLGPQPRTIAEYDVQGTIEKPHVFEFRTRFSTESAGVSFVYDYDIPNVLENFWLQGNDSFARPEMLISWFEIEGPLYDSWPPPTVTKLLPESSDRKEDERTVFAKALKRFMVRAFRRPVAEEEVAAKLKHYDAAIAAGDEFTLAARRAFTSVLVSPNFVFLAEPVQDDAKANRLGPFEIASRLSYLLWSSTPDDELLRAAASGKLSEKEEIARQTKRMLADRKSDAFVTNFAGQWLDLRSVGANPPARDLYPQYDRHLEVSMIGESEAFFAEILRNDLDVRSFIQSDFVVINERLARFYGIDGVRGDHFRRVAVPEGVMRGGIATQASILTTTSNGTRTSPVKRGTFIMKTLLGIDPGLPVANAGEIAPKVPGIDKATVRKRLEIHRELTQCARCHNKIDPLGFALENFNAAGEWREREGFGYKGRISPNDPLIDASSQMIDGTSINGVRGLQESMLAREDLFLHCLASKMLTYAVGRELGLADEPTLRAAVADMKQNGRTLSRLIQFLVTSEPFLEK